MKTQRAAIKKVVGCFYKMFAETHVAFQCPFCGRTWWEKNIQQKTTVCPGKGCRAELRVE